MCAHHCQATCMKLKAELKINQSILNNLHSNNYPSTRYQKSIASIVYALNSLKKFFNEVIDDFVKSYSNLIMRKKCLCTN